MEDNKDKELDGKLPQEGNGIPEKNDLELKQEMEELAKTFQEELNKAKAQAKEVAQTAPAEPEILIQDLEDIPEVVNVSATQQDDEIPPEELCDCCGEKRRGTKENPDSEYCIDCDRGLRHYPYNLLYTVLALCIIAFSFYACYTFADYTKIYKAVEKADSLVQSGKLMSAYDEYTNAANIMINQNVNGEMVYQRSLVNSIKLGALGSASSLSTQFKQWELKLPHLRKAYNSFELVQEMEAARNDAYFLVYQYETESPADIPYDELMAKLNALSDISPDLNPEKQQTSSNTTTTAPYNIQATKYSKQMLLFVKYYLASICQRDINEQIGYLEESSKIDPELTWIYAPMLGELYVKAGKDTTQLCETMRKVNSEDTTADLVEAMSLRTHGEYDKCIELCQKIINKSDSTSYEFYRQIALCFLIKGSYSDAFNYANTAYQTYGASFPLCNTLALCAQAVGREDVYQEMEKLFSDNNFTLSDEVVGYKNGTVTIEDILLKGDFDVQ